MRIISSKPQHIFDGLRSNQAHPKKRHRLCIPFARPQLALICIGAACDFAGHLHEPSFGSVCPSFITRAPFVIGKVLRAGVTKRNTQFPLRSCHIPSHEICSVPNIVSAGTGPPSGAFIFFPCAVDCLGIAKCGTLSANRYDAQSVANWRSCIWAKPAFLIDRCHLDMDWHTPSPFCCTKCP